MLVTCMIKSTKSFCYLRSCDGLSRHGGIQEKEKEVDVDVDVDV